MLKSYEEHVLAHSVARYQDFCQFQFPFLWRSSSYHRNSFMMHVWEVTNTTLTT